MVWLWIFPFSALTFGALILGSWLLDTPRGQTLRTLLKPPARGFRRRPARLLDDPTLSDIPGLDRLIRKWSSLGPLQRRLEQAGLKWRPSTVLLLAAVLGVLLGYLLVLKGPPFSFLFGAIGFIGGVSLPFVYVAIKRRQRFERIQEQLPEALALMARSLRIGHTLVRALQGVSEEMNGPLADELGYALAQQQVGGLSAYEALADLSCRVPLREIQFFVSAVQIQKLTGGNLAEVLDKLNSTIRARFKLVRQIQSLSAQGRLSGLVLSLLPVGVGAILYLVNPGYLSILFEEPIGHWMLAVMGVGELCGMLCIRKIVRIPV